MSWLSDLFRRKRNNGSCKEPENEPRHESDNESDGIGNETETTPPEMRFLIVGLGNIGAEYAGTRHNIGFAAVEHFVQQHNGTFAPDRYGDTATFRHKNKMLTILKPSTYMNLSGKAVRYHLDKLKIPLENLLVIYDDKDLPLGQLRLRAQGSGGTHNGVNHIITTLGTDRFARLRIGIGNDFPKGMQIDFVLGRFTEEEKAALRPSIEQCDEILLSFADQGIQKTMNLYNSRK